MFHFFGLLQRHQLYQLGILYFLHLLYSSSLFISTSFSQPVFPSRHCFQEFVFIFILFPMWVLVLWQCLLSLPLFSWILSAGGSISSCHHLSFYLIFCTSLCLEFFKFSEFMAGGLAICSIKVKTFSSVDTLPYMCFPFFPLSYSILLLLLC